MRQNVPTSRRKPGTPKETAGARWQWPSRRIAVGACLAVLLIGGVVILRTSATPQAETTTGCSAPGASSTAIAETTTSTASADAQVTAPDPPGTIDGAKNPELIPDDVALRMIVLAVAEPTNGGDEVKDRARAKVRPIGFSEDDAAAFLSLLAEYQDRVDAVDKQAGELYKITPIPDPAGTAYKQLVDLGKQKDQLTNDAVAALPAKVSADGLEKLRLYLPEAKKGMKIIPNSDTSLMSGN